MPKCSFLSVGCFSFLVIRLFASPLSLPVRSLPCCFSSYLPHMFLVPCFSGFVTLSNFSRSLLFALQILPFSLSSFFHVFSISSTLLIPLLVPFPWVLLAAPFPRFSGGRSCIKVFFVLAISYYFVFLITISRRFYLPPPLCYNCS